MSSHRDFDVRKPEDGLSKKEPGSPPPNDWEQIDHAKLSHDLFATPGDFPRGNTMGEKELRKAGISCKHSVDVDGRESTTAVYPNGVKVKVFQGATLQGKNRALIVIKPTSVIDIPGSSREHPKGSGIRVDSKGRQIAKVNKDGSVTVDAGDEIYTQSHDGIARETAIRGRDRKSWMVIDTDTPLGEQRPRK